MAKILAVDTSGDGCSVAIYGDGISTEEFVLSPREHTRKLLPLVDSVLAAKNLRLHDIDALAFGRGPGSFTGLRIAAGVIQGLAFGANLPVIPVSSMAGVAQGWCRDQEISSSPLICVALDARMGEVYFGSYKQTDGFCTGVGSEMVCAPNDVSITDLSQSIVALGSGWRFDNLLVEAKYIEKDIDRNVHALDIAILAQRDYIAGNTVPAQQALPVYLRNEISWKKLADQ